MILAGLLGWTHECTTATKPSPQLPVRRPHVVRVIGPFSPVWCTTVVSGSVPTARLLNYPEKPRQRSRTVRHNRAAQAEITTPYPGPRLPRAATVAHCRINCAGREGQRGRGRSSAEQIQPEERETATRTQPSSTPLGEFLSYIQQSACARNKVPCVKATNLASRPQPKPPLNPHHQLLNECSKLRRTR